MRQPELGKTIAELRKEKGLTQEELVELCNINVRTIQRIEAGEVNPRSYTIKNILTALGASLDINQDSATDTSTETSEPASKHIEQNQSALPVGLSKSRLGLGIITGILVLVSTSILMVLSVYSSLYDGDMPLETITNVLVIVDMLFAIAFYQSIQHLGTIYGNKLLAGGVIFYIVIYVMSGIFSMLFLSAPAGNLTSPIAILFTILVSVVFGSALIVLGAGLYSAKNAIGTNSQIAGVFSIIAGVLACSVIGMLILPCFSFVYEVILIMRLYQLYNKQLD
ncbi:MAG: helix-turn-helix domain-containing protein [Nonlabens sp.]